MADLQRDRFDIENLLAEYCLASDENRHEDWARLFADDGEIHAFRKAWGGFEALVGFISAAPEGIHMCGIPRIDLDGDRADVTVNFVFVNHDNVVWSKGLYIDDLVRTDAGWRIKSRKIKILKPSKKE